MLLSRCEVLSFISHCLLVTNSSVNIIIYCWKDAKFRVVLLSVLGLRQGASSKYNMASLVMVGRQAAAVIGQHSFRMGKEGQENGRKSSETSLHVEEDEGDTAMTALER